MKRPESADYIVAATGAYFVLAGEFLDNEMATVSGISILGAIALRCLYADEEQS